MPQFIASSTSSEIEKLKTLIKSENENIKAAKSSLKPKLNLIGVVYQIRSTCQITLIQSEEIT